MTKEEIRKWEEARGITRERLQAALDSFPPLGLVTATIVDTPAGFMVSVETLTKAGGQYVTPEAIFSAHGQGRLADLLQYAAILR